MALPIASRDLTLNPLRASELKLILDFLYTNRSGTAVNMVTGIGTIAPAVFLGLQAYFENRRDFEAGEMAYHISYPKSVQLDQNGAAAVQIDGLT